MSLRYGRKQYSIKQYGKYKIEDSGKPQTSKKKFMGSTRIKAVTKNKEKSEWVRQVAPVEINKSANKFRLKNNTGETVNSQTINIKGNLGKIRLRTLNEEITSESL